MAECEEGEPGQIVTRGANVMSGYVGDDQATAEAIHEGGWCALTLSFKIVLSSMFYDETQKTS